jgi:hypothetical protein
MPVPLLGSAAVEGAIQYDLALGLLCIGDPVGRIG